MKPCIKIVYTVLVFVTVALAQNGKLKFEHLTVEDGLSANTVLSIIQDSRGFLWIGTYDGLNRYDGYSFKIYKNDEYNELSLSNNKIYCLLEDDQGNIWIGTWGGGLNKFDRKTESFTRYLENSNDSNTIPATTIFDLCNGRKNEIYIATSDGGFCILNNNTGEIKTFTHNPAEINSISSNKINAVCYTNKNGLWIGTNNGLNNFLFDEEKFIRYQYNPNDPTSISNNYILCVYEDKEASIWVGTNGGGINKFNKVESSFTHYRNNPLSSKSLSSDFIYAIFEDSQSKLWIGSYDGGICIFNRNTESFEKHSSSSTDPYSISDNGIMAFCEDNSEILWIGTWDGGINKYNRKKEKFNTIANIPNDPSSLSNNSVYSLLEDSEGILWVGTEDGGLNKYDKKFNTFTHYLHNPNDKLSISNDVIYCLVEDKDGNIWVSTDGGGVNKLNKRSNKFINYKHNPNDPESIGSNRNSVMLLDSRGELWVGLAPSGISKLNMQTNKFSHFKFDENNPSSISSSLVYSIIEDSDSTIWFGTAGDGLYRYDRKSELFKYYKKNPQDELSISDNFVSAVLEDSKGRLWIGTQGGGLNKFNKKEEIFTHYHEKDGLPNNVIYGILEDNNNNLWISTNRGLARFDPETETFYSYDRKDGLQSNEFNQWACYKNKEGKMYFGGNNGFSFFHPDSLSYNNFFPQIVLTDFLLQHKPVPIGYDSSKGRVILNCSINEIDQLELNHDDNVISFEFASLNFHSPEKNKYAYKLQNFDSDWNYTDAKKRFITYTNLDPGKYVLRVIGTNNDGLWNNEGVSLNIIINSPWWSSWWAYSIYGIIVLTIVMAARMYDLKRHKLKHELLLEHKHNEKLEELDKIKTRFYTNISHEFRTPLTLILGPIDKILSRTNDEFVIKQSSMIKRNAKSLYNLINQLLDLSKLEAGKLTLEATCSNLVTFLKGITMSFAAFAEQKDISLKVISENNYLEVYFDKDKIEKIFVNILSNAIKFTPHYGKITVVIKEEIGKNVEVIVKDTGIGIPKEELPKLFDRFYQVDGTHTREGEGTGIGLSLTKELIELHKGAINISSAVGQWTIVKISIPLGCSHLSPDQIVKQQNLEDKNLSVLSESLVETTLPNDSISEHQINNTVILIVEDNQDVREYIKDSLITDYDIEEAANGEQGFRKAMNLIPDLIISDIMMPKMDGIELTKKIKCDTKTSHIPVILLTAKSDIKSKLEGLSAEAEDYLVKPFETRELKARVKNLIEIRRKLQEKFSACELITAPLIHYPNKLDEEFINKAIAIIENNISRENFSILEFSNEAGLSRSQLHRKLRAITGKSPSQFVRFVKISNAKKMIVEKQSNISEAAYSTGFSSPAYFTRCFKEQFGFPPSDLIKHI